MPLTPEQLERVRYLVDDDWGASSPDEPTQWADFDRTLARMSAEELHAFVDQMNFGGGAADRLTRVLAHPRCDRGTALMAYWRTRPLFYLPLALFCTSIVGGLAVLATQLPVEAFVLRLPFL